MLEELDPFDFVLAGILHMTVHEMQERLSNQEYLMWRAFLAYKHAMLNMNDPVGAQ